jgi:nicotinate-nucleotide pyrophosphorylase (carboxylating)
MRARPGVARAPEARGSARPPEAVRQLVELALREDLGPSGDVTSMAVLSPSSRCRAEIRARESLVVAGLEPAEWVFHKVDPSVEFRALVEEGQEIAAGTAVARVSGSSRSVMAGERTALNFMQRLSGVATLTRRYVERLQGSSCRLLDTRKTTPGHRYLEKQAVRLGGGKNHRMGLFDGVLIKDNHIAAAGGLRRAVEAARRAAPAMLRVEVEVDDLEQLREALEMGLELVLLDNLGLNQLREAVALRDRLHPGTRLEASGGISLNTVSAIASTGVDFVSAGALTHSAPAVDLGLDVVVPRPARRSRRR